LRQIAGSRAKYPALTGERHPLQLPPPAAVSAIAAVCASFVIVHPLTVVIDFICPAAGGSPSKWEQTSNL
jgi:hypothetical protein